jgi:DNA-binding response OmpR family regulator
VKKRVLVVEDDLSLGRVLRDNLAFDGFEVEWITDGGAAVGTVREFAPDLVLLDVSLPGSDGFELCGVLRQDGRTPIIFLTARTQKTDKMNGFALGADDYVTKPFDSAELSARIHALRRRTSSNETLTEYHFANIRVNFVTGAAYKNGVPLNLSVKELRLLRFLIARRHSVVSREELLHHVWGYRAHDTRTIDVHVAAVRRKLEDDPQHPHFILTERGKGYRFQDAKCKELLTEHSETLL